MTYPNFLKNIILIIYLFIYYTRTVIPPQRGRHATMPRKERRRKEQGSEKMEEKKGSR